MSPLQSNCQTFGNSVDALREQCSLVKSRRTALGGGDYDSACCLNERDILVTHNLREQLSKEALALGFIRFVLAVERRVDGAEQHLPEPHLRRQSHTRLPHHLVLLVLESHGLVDKVPNLLVVVQRRQEVLCWDALVEWWCCAYLLCRRRPVRIGRPRRRRRLQESGFLKKDNGCGV